MGSSRIQHSGRQHPLCGDVSGEAHGRPCWNIHSTRVTQASREFSHLFPKINSTLK